MFINAQNRLEDWLWQRHHGSIVTIEQKRQLSKILRIILLLIKILFNLSGSEHSEDKKLDFFSLFRLIVNSWMIAASNSQLLNKFWIAQCLYNGTIIALAQYWQSICCPCLLNGMFVTLLCDTLRQGQVSQPGEAPALVTSLTSNRLNE